MYLTILAVLFLPISTCKPLLSASYSIIIAPGAYFVQSVIFTEGEIATKCTLGYTDEKKNKISLDIDLQNEVLVDDEQYAGRITTVGQGICGIKGKNFTNKDPKKLRFDFDYKTKYGEKKSTSLLFNVGIYNLVAKDDITESVNLGSKKLISCGLINTVINCKLYNPEGVLVFDGNKCKYIIEAVAMEHIGKWKCVSSTLMNMEQYVQFVEYKLAENGIDTWYKEEDGYGIIGCKYNVITPNFKRPSYCQFVRPDYFTFTVTPSTGGITERYTYLGTNLRKYQCQLEFKLPRISSEEGRWKCLIDDSGGFINVGQNVFGSDMKIETNIIQKAELGETVMLNCAAPYAIEYCYLMSPTGDMHYGEKSEDFWKGECGFSIKVKESDFGQWSCHFSNPNDAIDATVTIMLQKYNLVKSDPTRIMVNVEEPVNLMCRTESPILYCRFVGPNGKAYHISENKSGDNIIYSGKGLGYGECGISIKNITQDQIGIWNCSIRTRNGKLDGDNEVSAMTMMYMRDEGMGTAASTIAIPIAIAVVAIVILIVAFYRGYKKRSNAPNNRRTSRRASSSSNTAFDIPMENIPTYSAHQPVSLEEH